MTDKECVVSTNTLWQTVNSFDTDVYMAQRIFLQRQLFHIYQGKNIQIHLQVFNFKEMSRQKSLFNFSVNFSPIQLNIFANLGR